MLTLMHILILPDLWLKTKMSVKPDKDFIWYILKRTFSPCILQLTSVLLITTKYLIMFQDFNVLNGQFNEWNNILRLIFNMINDWRLELFHLLSQSWICQKSVSMLVMIHYLFLRNIRFSILIYCQRMLHNVYNNTILYQKKSFSLI